MSEGMLHRSFRRGEHMIPVFDKKVRVPHTEYEHSLYSSAQLTWVSRETDASGKPLRSRVPHEKRTKYPASGPFTAAGRTYASLEELHVEQEESYEKGIFCKDKFGRIVFYIAERFPCFDSYDYAYENRYFRWFFICENGKLTRIHYTDETKIIDVTEDVLGLENNCLKEMNRAGYWEKMK